MDVNNIMNSRALFQTIIAVRGKNINVLCKDGLLHVPYKKFMKLMHNREVVSPGPHILYPKLLNGFRLNSVSRDLHLQ
jgi:hypothetical protein